MKQAVIQIGGKQYVVSVGQILEIELIGEAKTLEFEPLLVYDGDDVQVGAPTVKGVKVTAEVVDPLFKGEKIKVFKFKAKKRVKTLTGHRQKYAQVKITGIGNETAVKAPAKKSSPVKKTVTKKAIAKTA